MGASKTNPRYQMLSLRLSDDEHEYVSKKARQGRVSLSEAARLMMFARKEPVGNGK